MDEPEVIDHPEPEKSDTELMSDAGDSAFERLNQAEEEPEKPEPVAPKAPVAQPDDKGGNDNPAGDEWWKKLDERTVADLKAGHILPKHRFDEVNQRLQAYNAFGSPEELQRKLAEITKAPAPVTEKSPSLTPEQQAKDEEAKAYILSLFPFLKDQPQQTKQMSDFMRQNQERAEFQEKEAEEEHNKWLDTGTSRIAELAKEAGLDVKDPENMDLIARGVVARLHASKELSAKFYKEKNLEAVKAAFDDYCKRIFSGHQRKVEAQILKDKKKENRLPRPPASGVSPESEKPKSTADMTDQEFSKHIDSRLQEAAVGE